MSVALKQSDFIVPQTISGDSPGVLADIYRSDTNLVRWQRPLDIDLDDDIHFLLSRPALTARQVVAADVPVSELADMLRLAADSALIADIRQLIEMYADLFMLHQVGVRFEKIDKTMCPRFHTDRLACRLVTTYHGNGTQWLAEDNADRSKLGAGAAGLPDNQSGIYRYASQIHSATAGDVLLLKGDGWPDSPVAGIIHRSPPADLSQPRLLLTLDFAD
ncbi:MAG: DUF1826 domain-containing protein [Methylophaga sp.]